MVDQELIRLIGNLEAEVATLNKLVTSMNGKIENLEAQANRWKGAFALVLFLGGIAGWLLSYLRG